MTKPVPRESAWCYRIDAVPMDPDRMISWGSRDTLGVRPNVWAERLAAHCRLERTEYRDRPIRVMVWPHRGDAEHYRAAPPPSPVSVSFFFPAGAPGSETHRCDMCSVRES